MCCAERDLYLQVSGGCLIFLFEDSIVTLATNTVVQMGNLIPKGCLKEKHTQTAGSSDSVLDSDSIAKQSHLFPGGGTGPAVVCQLHRALHHLEIYCS